MNHGVHTTHCRPHRIRIRDIAPKQLGPIAKLPCNAFVLANWQIKASDLVTDVDRPLHDRSPQRSTSPGYQYAHCFVFIPISQCFV
jgi:hypothetical protein